jgi:hypothetical protein
LQIHNKNNEALIVQIQLPDQNDRGPHHGHDDYVETFRDMMRS